MVFGFDRTLSRKILKLAGPVVLAMASQTAINLLDTIMVGRLPKSYSIAGQAAIGYSVILLWAVGGFLSALAVGTQAIAARRYGEGKHPKAGQVLTNSLLLTTTTGLLFGAAAVMVLPYVFPFFNDNPAVLRFGIPYAQIRMVGVLSMVATVSFKSFYDGLGRTRVHMVAALVMNVTNAVLNWFLIFGVGFFPQLYVTGAALASTIASYLGLFIMFAWTLRRKDRRRYNYYRWSNVSGSICRQIVRLSLPSGLATVAVMSGFGIFLKIVGQLDANAASLAVAAVDQTGLTSAGLYDALRGVPFAQPTFELVVGSRPAIYTAGTKVIIDTMSIAFMSCIAFGTATATLVSQSLGARRPDKAARYGWESVKIGMTVMSVLGAIAVLFPDAVLSVFSKDIEVITAARGSLRLLGFSVPLIALGLILAQALFGAGNTRYVMYVEMALHFTCLIPLAYLLGVVLDFGLIGVWTAAFTYIFLLAGLMAWKFWEGKWKLIRL